jgi:hypothetical protein
VLESWIEGIGTIRNRPSPRAETTATEGHVHHLELGYIGLEVDDPEAPGADAFASAVAHTVAPWGARLELVHGLAGAGAPFASPLVPGGFLTEGVGFGHVVVATTAFDDAHRFVTEGLGLVQTDWLATEVAPGVELEVRFYHCNARHHRRQRRRGGGCWRAASPTSVKSDVRPHSWPSPTRGGQAARCLRRGRVVVRGAGG